MKRSIRSQMMLIFSLLIVIPFVISSVYMYFTLESHLKENYIRHQERTVRNLGVELTGWRNKLEDLSLRIYGDPAIQQFLRSDNEVQSAEQLELALKFRQTLQMYSGGSDPAVSVYVVRGTSAIYGDGRNPALDRYIRQRIPAAEEARGRPVWDNVPGGDKMAMIRQINDTETDLNRPLGYLVLVFDSGEIRRMVGRYALDEGQQFAVLDAGGRFGFSTDPALPLSEARHLERELSAVPERTFDLGGHPYVAFANRLDDWRVVSWIPEREVVQPARELFLGILFVTAVLILFSVVMVLFLSYRITNPLRMIQRKIKQMGEGFFGLKVPVIRDDEVGELATAINRMSDEIVSLIRINREEEAKRRLLELQTLEYQINPHFLYNTLDAINMLARKHRDPLIADMVTYLSRLFRIGLNQGRELITVAEEIQHVTYYLKIQEIRFSGQLYWDIQWDESLAPEKIIKFLLQPVVENSINHGIRKRDEPGHLYIRVWGEPDRIVLEVEDDGVGMDAERLAQVRRSLDEDERGPEGGDGRDPGGSGFGLRNVHQRIRLHYGAGFGLRIDSAPGVGTTVTIRLPRGEEQGA